MLDPAVEGDLRMARTLLALLGLMLLATAEARAQAPDVALFAQEPEAFSASLSPDGSRVAYIRATADETQLIVVDLATNSARPVQSMSERGGALRWVAWKGNDRLMMGVLAHRRQVGEIAYSAYRVVSLRPDGSGLVQMFEDQMTRLARGYGSTDLLDDLPSDPDHVLLMASDNLGIGVWRAEVATGRVERVVDGTWETMTYITDGEGYPVLRQDWIPRASGWRYLHRAPGERRWTRLLEARQVADSVHSPDFQPLGPGPGAGQVYVLARMPEEDLLSLYLFNTGTGEFGEPLQRGAVADVSVVWIDPRSHEVMATCETVQRTICRARDPRMQRHLDAISAFFAGGATVSLADMSEDGARWLVYVDGPQEPGGYFLYDRNTAQITAIALRYPAIEPSMLAPTTHVTYQSRDGVSLWAYVTARPGDGPRPTIIYPHGGPEVRDEYGYDDFVQLMASRGYVVVQPNFRGSSGFGRAFAQSGHGEWGGRMQNDVTDAVRHLIDIGVADPERVCIVGASYGGYAALAGGAFTPELYRCVVSIAGVTDLPDIRRSDRIHSGSNSVSNQYWELSIGNAREDRDALIAASPTRHAANFRAPVLLVHGEGDDNVLIRQSELMDAALREAGKDVRFLRYEGGHSWYYWEPENRLAFYRELDAFLAQHLAQ
jgi:dipeptidyl aminopeptidase/acylaminoacyl peptidase